MKKIMVLTLLLVLQGGQAIFANNDEMKKADALYEERNDISKAKEAMVLYENLAQTHPNSYEVWWKLARARYWAATYDSGLKESEKARMYDEGVQFARYSTELKSDNVAGYYWLGINLGKFGKIKGIFKAMSLLPEIRRAMRTVVELDPSYEGGAAHMVLGIIFYRLPRFTGGDIHKSISHLEKAVGYGPKNLKTHLALGESYYKNKEFIKAKAQFQAVMQLPVTKKEALTAEETKEKAQHWLNSMME